MKSKKCSYCHAVKLLDNFHKDRTMIDNHASRCIACTKSYYKRYYQKKSDMKSRFIYESLEDLKYIKDKNNLFNKNGNGWWLDSSTTKTRKPLAKRPKKGVYNADVFE
tara:strand:- start:10129 stop:10452 length:324 start_codon:yes stop_codon:yes gene_type:complete